MILPFNNGFATTNDYQNYRLVKQMSHYDDDVTQKQINTAKKIAKKMKNCAFSVKDPKSVVAFFENFESACNACGIHEGPAMWLFKHGLTSAAETAVRVRVTLTTSAKVNHEGVLKSYAAIVQFLLNR